MVCSLLRRNFFTTDFSHEYFQPLIFPILWYITINTYVYDQYPNKAVINVPYILYIRNIGMK